MTNFRSKDDGTHYPIGSKKGLSVSQRHGSIESTGTKIKQIKSSQKRWGFDLTDFKPNGFQRVLKELGIPESDVTDDMDELYDGTRYRRGFIWHGEGIEIETGNNPITGEYATPRQRANEKDYASYIGIEGVPELVDKAVKLIKQNSSYRKGESENQRDFI